MTRDAVKAKFLRAAMTGYIQGVLKSRMILKVYSLIVLSWDIVCFIVGTYFSIILGIWHVLCPPAPKSVDGDIIVIVGAGRGIGKELALQFAVLGAKVASWDIDRDATLTVAAKAKNSKGKIFPYIVDVTDREQVFKAAEQVKQEMGLIKMLINCCNMPSPRCLIVQPPHDIPTTIDLCVMSHFWTVQAILPHMLEQKKGHIVVLSSVAGLTCIRELLPLTVSQFAVQGIAESVRQEIRKTHRDVKLGVTLVHIYPFLVSPEYSNDIRLRIPSYFGTMLPSEAARQVIAGVRRGSSELSVPGFLMYISSILRLMPYKMTIAIRDFIDTGVDFG